MKNESWSFSDVEIVKNNMNHGSEWINNLLSKRRSLNAIRNLKYKIRKGLV